MALHGRLMEEFIAEIAGEEGIPVTRVLKRKEAVSEADIAKSIKRDINETRNLLYQLHHNSIVTFSKRKEGKKGWYNYYWSFNKSHLSPMFIVNRKKRLSVLRKRLEKEKESSFFICESNCMRFEFSNAMEMGFKCPECGTLLNEHDNQKDIRKIEEDMKKISDQIKQIET